MVHVQPPPALVVRVRHKKRRWPLIILVALAWFASIGAALLLTQQTENFVDRAEINRAHKEQDALLQRITVLERSEQVARAAYGDLQQNLKDRQEEISALRADLAFYSRLTNGSKLEALNVHGVHLQAAASPRVYNFSITLTQTLKSGQIATGHMRVSVNGVRDGKLVTLGWGDLAPNQDGSGLPFSFKYFQQITGTLMLPDKFTPNRIRVEADAAGDMGKVDQEFAWVDALAEQEVSDVQQQQP
jgi:uncharacterized protein DUF6776